MLLSLIGNCKYLVVNTDVIFVDNSFLSNFAGSCNEEKLADTPKFKCLLTSFLLTYLIVLERMVDPFI